jgi:hypothetical protein
LAPKLLSNAPEPKSVFKKMMQRLHPTGWSGSLATKLESRLKLLRRLAPDEKLGLADTFVAAQTLLQKAIDAERKREAEESRSVSERFE